MACNLLVQLTTSKPKKWSRAELDAGFQGYGGYTDMPMESMDGAMMADDYPSSLAYERQAYS